MKEIIEGCQKVGGIVIGDGMLAVAVEDGVLR